MSGRELRKRLVCLQTCLMWWWRAASVRKFIFPTHSHVAWSKLESTRFISRKIRKICKMRTVSRSFRCSQWLLVTAKNSWRMHVLWAYPTERAQSISLVVMLNSLLEHELPFAVPKQQACCITSTRLRAITQWQRGVVILVTNTAECWKSQHSWDHQVSVTGIREGDSNPWGLAKCSPVTQGSICPSFCSLYIHTRRHTHEHKHTLLSMSSWSACWTPA